MADFLFEIGLEEVPARMIAGAEAELARRVVGMLERERLVEAGAAAESFSTPRRLAVLVRGVEARQEDVAEEVLGPAVKIAYKDGVPGPAAEAFARKAGVAVGGLRVVATAKGDYVAATAVKAGRTAAAVIAAEMPKELAGIYWAKSMHWRAGKPERFVRPVRWMVALLGEKVVPMEFAGCLAGRETWGHRVLSKGEAIRIAAPADYVEALGAASVMAEVEARRHTIRKALDRVCRTLGEGKLRWREDAKLVDKMTHMTEWPSVIAGGFDAEYLALPEEVLVTVMRDHQGYFAVVDGAGKLEPYFLAVLNTAASAEGEAVIRHGNERVLRARFNDARFFWEFDQRVSLEERVGLLEKVIFQKELGSYGEKTRRMLGSIPDLVETLRQSGTNLDGDAVSRAALLAKTDLTTELVKEFTELQGVVGGLYARAQGFSEAVSSAIYDQYMPVSMEDAIPRSGEGQLLALTDKADTIAGMFSLGLEPTGSKDPFALRRAANGIVRILAEGRLLLSLNEISSRAVLQFAPLLQDQENFRRVHQKMLAFLTERLEFYLREAKGHAYDVVKAVLAVGADDVRDVLARAEAVTLVRGSEDFAAVSAAFKRMKNILTQAAEKGFAASREADPALMTDAAEKALWRRAQELADRVAGKRAAKDYVGALEEIATLRPQVDAFFAAVMVMDPDAEVRANRLALLGRVLNDFGGIADFSEIVVAG